MPIIYGFIDIFAFDIILKTCKRTENPPNPSKKEQIIIEIGLEFMATNLMPLVTSIIPVNKLCK